MFGESQCQMSDIQAQEQTCQWCEEENEITMLNSNIHMSVRYRCGSGLFMGYKMEVRRVTDTLFIRLQTLWLYFGYHNQ
jgi:hypothetical protein